MQTVGLRFKTEAAISAAQEQALATNNIQNMIYKMDVSPLCRLCKKCPETVGHIISGCTPITKKKYTPRHNAVAKYIHWNILQDHGDEVSEQWWLHKPVKTMH
eukprot:12863765-Ditylum_brightwellii.AAC.1